LEVTDMGAIAVRVFLVLALAALAGFFTTDATTGGILPVLLGALGMFAAGSAVAAVIDTTPKAGHPRPPVRQVRS
jgi:hypothetical protein